jgi:SAM-dependent methyltransferase
MHAKDQYAKESLRVHDWDQRAARMRDNEMMGGGYTRGVLASLDLRGCRSLLDIGCGVGNLVVPLAARLDEITALDASSKMLARLQANLPPESSTKVRLVQHDWSDASWDDVPIVDLVTASRSFDMNRMDQCLAHIQRHTRKRACITLRQNGHGLDSRILQLLGIVPEPRPDYQVLLARMADLEGRVRWSVVDEPFKRSAYTGFDEFLARVEWSVGTLSRSQRQRLESWYQALPVDESGARYYTRNLSWCLVHWEVA